MLEKWVCSCLPPVLKLLQPNLYFIHIVLVPTHTYLLMFSHFAFNFNLNSYFSFQQKTFWCSSDFINSPESCCLLDSTKTFLSLSLLLSLSFLGFHRKSYNILEPTVLSYFSDIQWSADCPCLRSARPARVNCLEALSSLCFIPQESVFGGV